MSEGRVVLSAEAERSWAQGPLTTFDSPSRLAAAKQANPDALPPELLALSAREFDLYDGTGKRCTTHLHDLRVVAEYGSWNVEDILGEDVWERYEEYDDIPERLIRAGVWDSPEVSAWLLAEVDSDCEGALWARDAALDTPILLTLDEDPSPLGRERVAAFHRSEQLAEIRTAYLAYLAEYAEYAEPEDLAAEPGWLEHVAAYPASASTWRDSAQRVRYLEFEFGDMGEGCGYGFDSSIAELARVDGGARVESEHAPGAVAVFDADLDGKFEFLYREDSSTMNVSSESEALELWLEREGGWDCPC